MMFDKIAAGRYVYSDKVRFSDNNKVIVSDGIYGAKTLGQRFCVSRDIANLARAFIMEKGEAIVDQGAVLKIKPLIRSPYPNFTWFEYQKYDGTKIGIIAHQPAGYENNILIIPFVEENSLPPFTIAPERIFASGKGVEIPCKFVETDLHEDVMLCGFSGEIALELCAILAFINSPNVVRSTDVITQENVNQKRVATGKTWLHSYRLLEIKKEIKRQLGESLQTEEGRRLHWKRGHFKIRKTGIFWWNPHLAGRKELGFIEKDYAVNG